MNVLEIVKKKEKNIVLTYDEIKYVVEGFLNETVLYDEMTSFIKAIYEKGLTREETYFLTDIMIKSGNVIDLSGVEKPTVDKHSTGGIGDKTSLILLPICASLGVCVPKMSGRSLGITGGTVDKLESIPGFKSNITEKKFLDIINTVGCIDICQSKKIAIADKKIYSLRDATGYVDSIPLIASSIMSKKIASGCKNIVIDLKVGSGAFITTKRKARRLAKLMIYIGKKYNRKVVCVLTDMNRPLGTNIGNILEIKEVINFFDKKRDKRLEELIITLASYMISISKNISFKKASNEVKLVLNNGMAKSKFYEWIASQGGNIKEMKMNAHRIEVKSVAEGYVNEINANIIGSLSSLLGSTRKSKNGKIDESVGIVLRKNIGDYVKNNDILATIYYNEEIDGMIKSVLDAYKIEEKAKKCKSIILKVIR